MCFNAEVSLATFAIGTTGSIYLWKYNRPLSIFYGWVVLMQLIEFFLWKNQKCSDSDTREKNITFTRLGALINNMEPIILWLAIILFSSRTLSTSIHVWMIIFCALTGLYMIGLNMDRCTVVTKESFPHLHWKWNEGSNYIIYYAAFLFSFIILSLEGLEKKVSTINAFLVVISFFLSHVLFSDTHSTGALWCVAAAFAPWLFVGYYATT